MSRNTFQKIQPEHPIQQSEKDSALTLPPAERNPLYLSKNSSFGFQLRGNWNGLLWLHFISRGKVLVHFSCPCPSKDKHYNTQFIELEAQLEKMTRKFL